MSIANQLHAAMDGHKAIDDLFDKLFSHLDMESKDSIKTPAKQDYERQVCAVLSQNYSDAEMAKLVDFFQSAIGRTFLEKQGQVAEQYSSILRDLYEKYATKDSASGDSGYDIVSED